VFLLSAIGEIAMSLARRRYRSDLQRQEPTCRPTIIENFGARINAGVRTWRSTESPFEIPKKNLFDSVDSKADGGIHLMVTRFLVVQPKWWRCWRNNPAPNGRDQSAYCDKSSLEESNH
jgi:hypothetical protein